MVTVIADPAAAPPETSPKPRGRRPRTLTAAQAARRGKVVASLSGPNVIPEDERQLERAYYGVAEAFRPRNRWQEWLAARIATLMTRIDRSERVERRLRDWASYRAFDFWEDDQRLAVEALGERLKRDPARVAAQLRRSPAGLDWLAARWRGLARLGPDDWTDERRELAYQLLGGDERVDPAEPGFVAAQVEALEADRGRVEEADALLRGLVESDLSDKDVPDLARLRREARAWHRQIQWYADQFHVEHPDRWDDPMRRPASEKVTPDGFREVNYNHFEGPRAPDFAPAPPPATVEPPPEPVERPCSEPATNPASGGIRIDRTNPNVPQSSPPAADRDDSSKPGRRPAATPMAGVLTREQARRLKRHRRPEDRGRDGRP